MGGSFWYLYWQVMYTSNSCVREKQRRKSDLRRSRGRALLLWPFTVSGFLSQFLNGPKSIFLISKINLSEEVKSIGLHFILSPPSRPSPKIFLRNSCRIYVHRSLLSREKVNVHLTKRPVGKKFCKGGGVGTSCVKAQFLKYREVGIIIILLLWRPSQ